jgi:LPS-assembly protein
LLSEFRLLRVRLRVLLLITAFLWSCPWVWPQASQPDPVPDAPGYPIAVVVPEAPAGVPVRIEAERQEKHGSVYTLTGGARIDYKRYILTADKISYNQETGDAEADGHVRLQGKQNNELILADHGNLNFELETGRFENVTGSVGRQLSESRRKTLYTTGNPFLFTGKLVIKEGPERYRIIDGTMTSCELPDPDWQIHSSLIQVSYGQAKANGSYFTLLGAPILYLPYVTHPVSEENRQSGFLIPELETSSTKGTVIGESIYLVLSRSADLTIGTQYFSKRGWSPNGDFRYRGRGEDFVSARFTALFDRGLAPDYINQGGQDIILNGRRDFDEHNRAVASAEYLSSYVYREAFAESFALAVASQVTTSVFLTHNDDGLSASIHFDRYQSFQGITQVQNTFQSPQIRITYLPSLDLDTVERPLQGTPLHWSVDGSAAVLNRSEPAQAPPPPVVIPPRFLPSGYWVSHSDCVASPIARESQGSGLVSAASKPCRPEALPGSFQTGEVGRFDLYPHLSLPLNLDGWTLRPEFGVRETFYTQSQISTSTIPKLGNATVNRSDLEAGFELRPPLLVRDFKAPSLEKIFGSDLRHIIEPEIQYHYVAGISNFSSIPRFDPVDVASDTNDVEFSLTQRLLFKHLHPKPCKSGDLPPPTSGVIYVPWSYTECGGDTSEWITWKLAAKYFFDPYFGGAAVPFRRNVLASTLDLTGVAFLNGPRNASPVISRLQVRTSEHMDLEWDADYDFKNKRLDASNIFADYRRENLFGSVSYSTLQALNGSFYANLSSQVTKYNLLRLLLGFGSPTRRGLGMAANAGYDFTQDALQYGGIEASYNLNCCGLAVEYRRLALGSVRNENYYLFNVTLAGVGSAGTLTHSERIF